MNEAREQALAQFLEAFGADKAAEIVMYVLRDKRDTILEAKLLKHLNKADLLIEKRQFNRFAKKYGIESAKRAFPGYDESHLFKKGKQC